MLRRFVISFLIAAFVLPLSAHTRPRYGGTLHVEIEGDPWQRPDGLARRLVLDGLTTLDTDGAVRPALAVEWSSENDDHRWQFKLRPGVHFHDGSSLTSIAVVASLNSACPEHCPWSTIRAVGSSVVFLADAPMPELPALLAGDEFRIVLTITSDGKTPAGNIGTGPFQVSGFESGVLKLSACESCWQGRPFVDAVEIRVHRSVHDQWLDLSTGHADLAEVPAEMLRQAQQQRLGVLASPPASLLALQISDTGALANPQLRGAISAAIDRNALSNVIYQKQGWITGSLLPQAVTGYSFLFPTDRDLNKSHELRGGQSVPALSLTVDGNGAMQLAAQRIALDLHEAGFSVQLTGPNTPRPDLVLRRISLASGESDAAIAIVLRNAGQTLVPVPTTPSGRYKTERDFIDRHTLIPLIYLPRAYAFGARVRDMHLNSDGSPDLAAASLGDTQ